MNRLRPLLFFLPSFTDVERDKDPPRFPYGTPPEVKLARGGAYILRRRRA